MDNCAVLPDVCRRWRNLQQLGNVVVRMRLVIDPALFHLVEYGDGVDVLREVEHRVDGLENIAVLLQIELVRLQKRNHVRHAPLVNEHRAEHRLLRFQRLRHLTAEQLVHGHGCSPPQKVYIITNLFGITVL